MLLFNVHSALDMDDDGMTNMNAINVQNSTAHAQVGYIAEFRIEKPEILYTCVALLAMFQLQCTPSLVGS